jgi:alpha-L-arabinofuranosidase
MKKVNIQWVRYPGGEKSDRYFFAEPPWDSSDPRVFGSYKSFIKDVLNFDEYMSYIREIDCSPFVVVPYESEKRTGIKKERFLKNAVAWVHYVNITKRYGVLYWEIGNENWHNKTGSGMEIAHVAKEFAVAM